MSVRKGERKPGKPKLRALEKAEQLFDYTILKCKSEKIFPKSQRWVLSKSLIDEAAAIVKCISMGNEKPSTAAEVNERFRCQYQALGHLRAFETFLDAAYRNYPIEEHEFIHWSGLLSDTDAITRSWIKSDQKRYVLAEQVMNYSSIE